MTSIDAAKLKKGGSRLEITSCKNVLKKDFSFYCRYRLEFSFELLTMMENLAVLNAFAFGIEFLGHQKPLVVHEKKTSFIG